VGVALALQRRSRGLSQQQVGEAIGVEPETISRMETGVISPSLKRLYQLAVVLDCPLDALLGRASVLPHDLLRQLSDPPSLQDGDDQPRSPMRSKSSEQDGDPEI
jgi:transcriptional regulator with XRE-family HTH domain